MHAQTVVNTRKKFKNLFFSKFKNSDLMRFDSNKKIFTGIVPVPVSVLTIAI
jgi:hypothetical protein